MSEPTARTGPATTWRFVVLLLPVAGVLLGARALAVPDPSRRNFEYLPEMVRSAAIESQTVTDLLPGAISEQPLVPGVVVRGALPFRYGPTPEEAVRAGRELVNPVAPGDADAERRGAEVFRIHCVPCHDAGGSGQGLAVLRGMLPPPPLQGVSAMEMPDGQMFHLLALGRGNMPAMRARLSAADRWNVIRHVRALQAPRPAPPPGTPGDGGPSDGGGEQQR